MKKTKPIIRILLGVSLIMLISGLNKYFTDVMETKHIITTCIAVIILFFLFLTIIGGGLFSTSSGIRFIKFILLIKFSFNELFLVARPKYILSSNLFFSNLKIKSDEVNKYFLSFLF